MIDPDDNQKFHDADAVRAKALKLRPAHDLTAERETRRQAEDQRSHDLAMARAIAKIEDAHKRGMSECSDQTFPQSVIDVLKAQGYRVTRQPACGMGDVAVDQIEWD